MHFKSSSCFLMDYVTLIDCACPSVFIQIQTHFIMKDKHSSGSKPVLSN